MAIFIKTGSFKTGSSGMKVYLGDDVVEKVGPFSRICKEYNAYERLQSLLEGEKGILPEIKFFLEDTHGRGILILERLNGDGDLEEYILATRDEQPRLDFIATTILSALNLLGQWQTITTDENPILLLEEILQGLKAAYQRLGQRGLLDWDELTFLLEQKGIQSYLIAGIKLGPCHRDFCTNNVWPMSNGDVRVFDPRWALPGSDITSSGHTILDIVDLYINIERLQSDRAKNGLEFPLPLQLINKRIKQQIKEEQFYEELYQLALLRRYLDFASCDCNHCLAPERRHRFALMKKRAKETGNKLVERLRTIIKEV